MGRVALFAGEFAGWCASAPAEELGQFFSSHALNSLSRRNRRFKDSPDGVFVRSVAEEGGVALECQVCLFVQAR